MTLLPADQKELHPADLDAFVAARAIRSGSLTSMALVRSCLERIERRDAALKAFVHLNAEDALAQAATADKQIAGGMAPGPLHGVPVAVKDVIDAAGYPCEHGSPIFQGRIAEIDAECVRQLRESGAIILGKTVTTELASLTPAGTRNPHNPEHTPGGSSSGSAVAVATGMAPLALGTQTAGSVIRPASYCGVFGFKPTLGLISRRGVLLQSHTLDTVGVLGRSLADVALAVDCMAAQDEQDEVSFPRGPSRLLEAATAPPRQPSLAFCRTPVWDLAEATTRKAFEELIPQLDHACFERELPPICDRIADAQRLMQFAENAYHYGPLFDTHADQLSPGMRERLAGGMRTTAREYQQALLMREPMYRAFADHYAAFDAILCPASPDPAPRGLSATGDPVFNGLWTYLGVPALTIPLFEADGLPFGLQMVGRRHEEARLLRAAAWLIDHLKAGA